jgi:hypothetical protein
MYTSEASAWSDVTSLEHPDAHAADINPTHKVHVGDALYFACDCETTVTIVRYDVVSKELSIMDGPAGSQANHDPYVLVETGDAALGFANVQGSRISLWSLEDDSADGMTWGQQRVVVELEKLLPPLAFSAELYVTGFTKGVGVIVLTNAGTFTIDLESLRVKNVPGAEGTLRAFPYTGFYTPGSTSGLMYFEMFALSWFAYHLVRW